MSFTLGLTTASNAETWSCTYLYNGEADNAIYVREGDRFYSVKSGSHYDVIYEDDGMISLHSSYNLSLGPIYFAVLLDKTKKMFASIGLRVEKNSTYLAEGKCEVY